MNDERPIEKLLRRYAKKRRDDAGAPVELHPATRRLLQGEVARQFSNRTTAGDRQATTFAQIVMGWRGRLIWAVPIVIALGVGLWALFGTDKKSGDAVNLAKNTPAPALAEPVAPAKAVAESFKALEADKAASSAPSLASQPSLAYTDRDALRDETETGAIPATKSKANFEMSLADTTVRRKQSDLTTANGLAAVPGRVAASDLAQTPLLAETRSQTIAAQRALAEPAGTIGDETTQTMGLASSSPAKGGLRSGLDSAFESQGRPGSPPASKPVALAPDASGRFYQQEVRGGSERDKLQAISQMFVNRAPASRYAKTAKSGPITPVLASFQVEQSGNQVRVIDRDGSTYVGEMNAPVAGLIAKTEVEKKGGSKLGVTSEGQLATRQFRGSPLPDSQNAQSFVYRVAGTNRTLNQQVVFTWNFVELTNALAAAPVKAPAKGGNVLKNQIVPAQQFPALLNNSVINGRAQLGNAKEIEINAVPVSP